MRLLIIENVINSLSVCTIFVRSRYVNISCECLINTLYIARSVFFYFYMFELFCNFIRSSKAVVGRFIIIFLLSTVAVFVCNAFLIEDFLTAFGKASHTVLGILVLSLFLQIF